MTDGEPSGAQVAARARAWRDALHAAVCDVIEPWEHGTVVRSTRHPGYYDLNVVRVERDPAMGAEELAAVADRALAGLGHRRLDFDVVEAAERLRPAFEARGWTTTRLLVMRHAGGLPAGEIAPVEEVPYDAVEALRVAWHREDFPAVDPGAYLEQAREVALRRGARVLGARVRGEIVAFAQIESGGDAAEVAQVYVRADHRGRGLGTALTRAAIEAAGHVRDLWIAADDEDRPKRLYARLGFRAAWTRMDFLRIA